MPRLKHQDKSSSSSRYISGRMRVGASSFQKTIDTKNCRGQTTPFSTKSNGVKSLSASSASSRITATKAAATTPMQTLSKQDLTSTSISMNDDVNLVNADKSTKDSSSTTSEKDDTLTYDCDYDDEIANQFSSFDFDEESTPPKAIIWKDANDTTTSHENQLLMGLNSPKTITTTSTTSILKENNSSTPKKQKFSSSSSSSSPPLSATKKKISKVTFHNNVKFRQKTPVKIKRTTKKSPNKKSSQLSSFSRRKSPKSKSSSLSSSPSPSSPPLSNTNVNTPLSSNRSVSAKKTIVTPTMAPNEDETVSTPKASIPSWIPKRGVAIDTRVLETFAGDAVGKMFQKYVLQFFKSASMRGLCPAILATTILKENKRQQSHQQHHQRNGACSNRVIDIRAAHLPIINDGYCDNNIWSEKLIPLLAIKPPSNVGNTKNRNVVHVPKRLLACDSWRMIGDLVDAITAEGARSNTHATPIEITIISNDVAFFTDPNIDSHKRAVARVWERLRIKFHSNLIRSVHLIIFESKIAALDAPNSIVSTHSSNSSYESSSNRSDNINISANAENDSNIDPTPHRFKIAYCVREIQNYIVKLSEKEYKNQGGGIESWNGMPMNLRLELKDSHPILYSSILQQWSRDILHSATSDIGRICFDLPETFDGTQSAVTLDLSYSILPYRVDSPMTRFLLDDLKGLSGSYVEVVQLVPLDSVDLSFLYGTPLSAKAGIEGDLDQYKHMQVLVGALFDHLGSHDVALVLRSSSNNCEDSNEGGSVSDNRIFLLMAQVDEGGLEESEESPYKATGRGMLYHYVHKAEHVLEEPNQSQSNSWGDEDEELVSFSAEYIDNSLGLLECLKLSPYETSPHQ